MKPVIKQISPLFRAIKYQWLWRAANWQGSFLPAFRRSFPQMVFIIGCGRSGTTILGNILSVHPQIYYLFEPYHMWAAIDRRTDALNLFNRISPMLLMNEKHCSDNAHRKFNRLIRSRGARRQVLIEKTPLNSMRINYLRALAPDAKFIHLVRDGSATVSSIAKLSSLNSYKIAGKPNLNQWWGVEDIKWRTLVKDGISSDYYSDEVHYLNFDARGVYEWLISLKEVERNCESLGTNLFELTYDEFVDSPREKLRELCTFLEIEAADPWLEESEFRIQPSKLNKEQQLTLPPLMCNDFNNFQNHYGFPSRAVSKKYD